MTLHSKLHWNVFGALVFSLSPVSCFVFRHRFRADPAWRSLHWPTLAADHDVGGGHLHGVSPTGPPEPPNAFNGWNGAAQRVFIITYLTWVFIFAWRLRMLRDGAPLRTS